MCGIIMLIFGILALVRGKFSLTRNRIVEGGPARIIGVILMLPLPLSFAVGLVIGAAAAAQNRELNPLSLAPIDIIVLLVCLGTAIAIAIATAKPVRKKRKDVPYDDELLEDEERRLLETDRDRQERPRRRSEETDVE